MNIRSRTFWASSAILLGTFALVGAAPVMNVKITSSAGKVVYEGKTNSQGMFASKNLAPGKYTVQFNAASTAKGAPLALMIHAGKDESGSDSVPASKFNKGGVAMKVDLDSAGPITGEVGPAGKKMAANPAPAAAQASSTTGGKSNLKTKVVDGKTYVWIPGNDSMGSSFGGHWVPEDSAEARNAGGRH